jgi:hypothetical protein
MKWEEKDVREVYGEALPPNRSMDDPAWIMEVENRAGKAAEGMAEVVNHMCLLLRPKSDDAERIDSLAAHLRGRYDEVMNEEWRNLGEAQTRAEIFDFLYQFLVDTLIEFLRTLPKETSSEESTTSEQTVAERITEELNAQSK